jgi:hypothetical protein
MRKELDELFDRLYKQHYKGVAEIRVQVDARAKFLGRDSAGRLFGGV